MRVAHFLLLGVVVLLAFLLRPPPYILHDVEALPALPNVPRVSLRAEVLLQGLGVEDVLFHAGDAFAGLMEGDFVRFDKERFEAHTVLQKRSRPSLFSGKVSRDGRFWFVFAQTGLASFSLDASKKKIIDLRLHALDVDDGTSAINFPNHLDVHPDGRIFFSDSYQREIPNQGGSLFLAVSVFSKTNRK
jgi:sugar lactone lactonase YvrE